jgi:hypothetical protein
VCAQSLVFGDTQFESRLGPRSVLRFTIIVLRSSRRIAELCRVLCENRFCSY